MYKTAKIPARRALLSGGGLAALLALAHLTGDALNSMLSALLPTLQERFGLTETVLALLVAASWLGSSLTQARKDGPSAARGGPQPQRPLRLPFGGQERA